MIYPFSKSSHFAQPRDEPENRHQYKRAQGSHHDRPDIELHRSRITYESDDESSDEGTCCPNIFTVRLPEEWRLAGINSPATLARRPI